MGKQIKYRSKNNIKSAIISILYWLICCGCTKSRLISKHKNSRHAVGLVRCAKSSTNMTWKPCPNYWPIVREMHGGFHHTGTVMRSFHVSLNKLLNERSSFRWFFLCHDAHDTCLHFMKPLGNRNGQNPWSVLKRVAFARFKYKSCHKNRVVRWTRRAVWSRWVPWDRHHHLLHTCLSEIR